MDELEILRRKKLEELQQKFSKGDNVPEYPDKPIHVTDKDLDAVVSKYNLVVVDCWAEWCAPCRMIAPAIEEMAKEMKGKVVFADDTILESDLIIFTPSGTGHPVLQDSDLPLSVDNNVLVDGYCRVNGPQKNVYAAGDVRKTTLRQLVVSAADGAIAATDAIRYIDEVFERNSSLV